MQLSFAALILTAAQLASAERREVAFIPYDCFNETLQTYGNPAGAKVSDVNLISGLDICTSKLTAISACTDMNTSLITGVVSTWGTWDYPTGKYLEVKRMNRVGNMAGIAEFDDNKVLKAARLPELNTEQDAVLLQYWYQEASPEQAQFYIDQAEANEDRDTEKAWETTRKNAFNRADTDNNNKLTKTEAYAFYQDVRPIDGKDGATDGKEEKLERLWNIVSILKTPADTITFNDYVQLEDMMTAFYSNGKLAATGHARGDGTVGKDLSHQCKTLNIEGEDYVQFINIEAGDQGVKQISVQTNLRPIVDLGIAVPNTPTYAYQNKNWENFDNPWYETRGFYGFHGTTDNTGNLSSIGFIEKDVQCQLNFEKKMPDDITWVSMIPGTENEKPALPTDYATYMSTKPVNTSGASSFVPASGTITPTETENTVDAAAPIFDPKKVIPSHDHDTDVQGGLLALTLIVWLIVIMLIVIFVYQFMKEKKSNSAIAYEVQ